MGSRNLDRIPIRYRRAKVESVQQMLSEQWDVISKCWVCGLIMRVDLALIARTSGPEVSLWNRKGPLPAARLHRLRRVPGPGTGHGLA
jgi:hypothetical protein